MAQNGEPSAAWIVALSDAPTAHSKATALLGGKAASLARLIRARQPVPNGFVVTTHAWRAILQDALRGVRTSAQARQIIREHPLPKGFTDAVSQALQTLTKKRPDAPLAVRSSAVDEDGKTLSFAGQQASYLGVVGLEGVIKHIREVWASMFNPASLVYRNQTSLEAVPSHMAVIVQHLVEASTAGVCFTVNPVGEKVGEMVLSAAPGLGETVVSGREADTFYVRRSDGKVLKTEIAHKPSKVVAQDGGAIEEALDAEATDAPSLDAASINRLVGMGARIEQIFDAPQDIEWAFDGDGGLWVLQSRPITTAPSIPGSRGGISHWTNTNVGEALPGVGTPMTWSIIRGFSRRGFEAAFGALGLDVPEEYALVGSFHGRVFLNLTQFASVITQIPMMKPETILKLAGGPSIEQIEGGYEEHSARSFLMRLPLTVPRILGSQVALPMVGRRWAKHCRGRRDQFFTKDLVPLSAQALTDVLAEVDSLFDRTGLVMIACSSNFLSSYVATHELLRRWGGPEAASRESQLFAGLSGMRSAEPGLEMLRMAHQIRRSASLEAHIARTPARSLAENPGQLLSVPGGVGLKRSLDTFLREYGHRAPREAEIATPRWREDPTFIFETIKTYLSAPFMPTPEAVEREQRERRQETTEAVRRHFTTGFGVIFRRVLSMSQSNARLREELRACVVDTLAMYRHVFLEIGRRLVDEGHLGDADDVFFLTHEEAAAYLSGQSGQDYALRVIARRAAFETFEGMPDPPDTFMLVDGVIVTSEEEPEGDRDTLQGLPGASGRVTGQARVILDPTAPDAVLKPGEILVAPLTDVGWTPLFLAASGVVMDKGGPLSHSCIVAREYGIPAVVNVKRGTVRIKTGDTITLDGDAGIVYLPKTHKDMG